MYTIFLADDEPVALEYMAEILKKKCPDYRIAGMASDGREALKKVKELKPDVLIFDICMPVMDGLELSAEIRKEGLPVIMIVVSGYSEFDYAKAAMQNGCMDYLLKPVVPRDVEKIFEKITQKLNEIYVIERCKLLGRICRDGKDNEEEMVKYFGSRKYYMALARYNGLPARLPGGIRREIFSEPHELVIAYGRDELESLYIFPEELAEGMDFENFVTHRVQKEMTVDGYCTIVLSKKPVACGRIGETASRFYQCLSRNIILGKTHVVNVDNFRDGEIILEKAEQLLMDDFRYYAKKAERAVMERILDNLLLLWIEKERPLLWIEHQVREMDFAIRSMQYRFVNDLNYADREYAIEELFSDAITKEQLTAGVREILFNTRQDEKKIDKLDTEEFMEQVEQYLEEHLEVVSAAHDATKEFGISYTYLGVLFQKYKGMSIKNFITMLRMEKAKKIIAGNSSVLIRDVAERIGYSDQFYFSRVFRTYTGMCPSDYIESVKNQKK